MRCRLCKKDTKSEIINGDEHCVECGIVLPFRDIPIRTHKDRPEVGEKRYYDEKWYMKNEKTLNQEIRSRHTTDGGKTVFRVDDKGNRIG